jgi:hypothetical protein
VGELVVGELVVGELVVGELVVGELVLGELVVGELVVGELVVGELVVGELVVVRLVVGELKLSWGSCRRTVSALKLLRSLGLGCSGQFRFSDTECLPCDVSRLEKCQLPWYVIVIVVVIGLASPMTVRNCKASRSRLSDL